MAKRLNLSGWLSSFRANDAEADVVVLTDEQDQIVEKAINAGFFVKSDLSVHAPDEEIIAEYSEAMASSDYLSGKNSLINKAKVAEAPSPEGLQIELRAAKKIRRPFSLNQAE